MTWAAISMPSITAYGLRRISQRSLNVAGSPSAALQTTDFLGQGCFRIVPHFVPVGNPPPPRPRSPDSSISECTAPGLILRAFGTAWSPVAFPYAAYVSYGEAGISQWLIPASPYETYAANGKAT